MRCVSCYRVRVVLGAGLVSPGDVRARAWLCVCVRAGERERREGRRVAWLERRVRALLGEGEGGEGEGEGGEGEGDGDTTRTRRLALRTADGTLLPRDEPLSVLRPGDTVLVDEINENWMLHNEPAERNATLRLQDISYAPETKRRRKTAAADDNATPFVTERHGAASHDTERHGDTPQDEIDAHAPPVLASSPHSSHLTDSIHFDDYTEIEQEQNRTWWDGQRQSEADASNELAECKARALALLGPSPSPSHEPPSPSPAPPAPPLYPAPPSPSPAPPAPSLYPAPPSPSPAPPAPSLYPAPPSPSPRRRRRRVRRRRAVPRDSVLSVSPQVENDCALELADVSDRASELVGVNDRTAEAVEMNNRASELVDVNDRASELVDINDRASELVDINDRASELVDINDRASELVDVNDRASELVDVNDRASELVDGNGAARERISVDNEAYAGQISLVEERTRRLPDRVEVGSAGREWLGVNERALEHIGAAAVRRNAHTVTAPRRIAPYGA